MSDDDFQDAQEFQEPIFPAPNGPQRASTALDSGRKKVALSPGHSPLDWANLRQATRPVQLRRITLDELALHNKKDDAWYLIVLLLKDRVARESIRHDRIYPLSSRRTWTAIAWRRQGCYCPIYEGSFVGKCRSDVGQSLSWIFNIWEPQSRSWTNRSYEKVSYFVISSTSNPMVNASIP